MLTPNERYWREFAQRLFANIEAIHRAVNSLVESLPVETPPTQIPPIEKSADAVQEDGETNQNAASKQSQLRIRSENSFERKLVDQYNANQKANEDLQRQNLRVQTTLCAATIAAFLAAAYYGCVAEKTRRTMIETLGEAKRANDLQERLTKGTYGVIFDVQAELTDGTVNLIFTNRGKVTSANLEAAVKVTPQDATNYRPMREPEILTVSGSRIPVGGIVQRQKHLVWFTKADSDRMAEWKEVISIEGSMRYDNGFGDSVPNKFCFLDVRWATGGDHPLIMRPLPCDAAKESVRIGPDMLRNSNQAGQQK